MIDETLALLALRNRVLGTTVVTTGSTTLVATSTGYTRASGSFVTDGFAPGMEITPSGFPANPVGIVKAVTALTLTTLASHAAASSASGRSLSVGVPAGRAWENVAFERTTGRPYIEESFIPATSRQMTFPANGGQTEETGLYVLRWYGLSGYGSSAIRKCVGAVKARLSPGTAFTLSDGSTLRVRADIGPYTGQVMPLDGGWSVCVLTVPWLARSISTVAA